MFSLNYDISYRSNRRRCSVKKILLKNFANFIEKQLCWRFFLIKVSPCEICAKFLKTPILRIICKRLLLKIARVQYILDPCKIYKQEDNYQRSTGFILLPNSKTKTCDRPFKTDWYRFTSRAGGIVPTKCPPKNACGMISFFVFCFPWYGYFITYSSCIFE